MLHQLPIYWGLALVAITWAAAIKDLKTYTIPHIYPGLVIALFIPALFFIDFSLPFLGWRIVCGLIAFFAGFILFAANLMGGGDVKLFAALGLWMTLWDLPLLIMSITFLGLFYTLFVLAYRIYQYKKRPENSEHSFGAAIKANLRSKFPYGPSIALGMTAFAYLIYS